jgi:hypothetical protein
VPRAVWRLTALGPALAAAALVSAPGVASAYPTSIVFAPTGDALAFGSFTTGIYVGGVLSPATTFGSAWGGLNVGVVPSVDIVTTPVGKLSFAGAELGIDIFGPDEVGTARPVFNLKIQLLKEAKYWPTLAVGFFQLSPDTNHGASLGYFALSKTFAVGELELGQLTLGMMRSFADRGRIAPQCFVSGASACLFRGSAPFEDDNGALLAGYLSPWIGPIAFSIDHVGGTSAVSSTNLLVNVRLWQDDANGFAAIGVGGFFATDRRDPPDGPGAQDGMFVNLFFSSSLTGLFGWDPLEEWSRDPRKHRSRRSRRDVEDPLLAPDIEPPKPRPTPTSPP